MTWKEPLDAFPERSVAVQLTSFVPIGNVLSDAGPTTGLVITAGVAHSGGHLGRIGPVCIHDVDVSGAVREGALKRDLGSVGRPTRIEIKTRTVRQSCLG